MPVLSQGGSPSPCGLKTQFDQFMFSQRGRPHNFWKMDFSLLLTCDKNESCERLLQDMRQEDHSITKLLPPIYVDHPTQTLLGMTLFFGVTCRKTGRLANVRLTIPWSQQASSAQWVSAELCDDVT